MNASCVPGTIRRTLHTFSYSVFLNIPGLNIIIIFTVKKIRFRQVMKPTKDHIAD